jgi:hypothetical protein
MNRAVAAILVTSCAAAAAGCKVNLPVAGTPSGDPAATTSAAAPTVTPPVAPDPAAPPAPPAPAAPPAAPDPVAPPAPPAPGSGKGTITGSVAFTGTAPARTPRRRDSDPFCAKTVASAEDVLVNDNNTLANVVVSVKDVPGTWDAPTTPAVVTWEACMYRPRVQGAVKDQKLEHRNADPTLHNVHAFAGTMTQYNQAAPLGGAPIVRSLDQAGIVYRLKDDIHPWEVGYVVVAANPFFAVTGADGSFTIRDVPAGTYKLEAWHELYGTKTIDVTVRSDGTSTPSVGFDAADKP